MMEIFISVLPNTVAIGAPGWILLYNKAYSVKEFVAICKRVQGKEPRSITGEERQIQSYSKKLEAQFGQKLLPPGGYSDGAFQYFANGVGYHAIPLRHFSDRFAPKRHTTGRYGVVRNHLYLINIKSIQSYGVGSPTALSRDLDYEDVVSVNPALTFISPSVVEVDVDL